MLWVINALLALTFLVTGARLAVLPKPALVKAGAHWAEEVPSVVVKALGGAEIVGALGLVLPLATRTAPVLAPIAAACLLVVMIGATIMHIMRRERPLVAIAVGLATIASMTLGMAYSVPA